MIPPAAIVLPAVCATARKRPFDGGEATTSSPWPWALHPLLQFPANFAASTLARHNRRVADRLDRYQRWRRETWWRNEMGDKQSHFQAAESFRR